MNRCPITYEPCTEGIYSQAGLRMLSPNLRYLNDLPYDARQQRREAVLRAGKMSIQGVQPKLSVRLNAKQGVFDVVDRGGRFVLKPQHEVYPNLPENEGLTMHLAKLCGIEVPVSGLVRSTDGSWSYFVRRFDRVGHKDKVAVEDFAQLSGGRRDTKYDSSMEQLVKVIDVHCTFPAVEKVKLLKRSLFNFLVGNEDMHLKNHSLITRKGKVELAPAYDYLSTTVAYLAMGELIEALEETALPLQGKKRRLGRKNWIGYYAEERLGLPSRVIERVRDDLIRAAPLWHERIDGSFLPTVQQEHYTGLLKMRFATLGW